MNNYILNKTKGIRKNRKGDYLDILDDWVMLLRNDKDVIQKISMKCNNLDYCNSLIALADNYKLLPVLFEAFLKNNIELNHEMKKQYFINNRAKEVLIRNQLKTMELIKNIYPAGQFTWIKGLPLSIALYNDLTFREVGDIDLLIDSTLQKSVVKTLLGQGFLTEGTINTDIGLRFSVNYNEIQMWSPFSTYLEIKDLSGEMDVFKSDSMFSDFSNNIMEVKIGANSYKVLNVIYTLFHLFLSAVSNSTTWFYMGESGLRDMYEIALYTKKYKINYYELFQIVKHYGICQVVFQMMHKINKLFPFTFKTNILQLFDEKTKKTHEQARLYSVFMQYYSLDIKQELFMVDEKTLVYFNALYHTYYDNDIFFSSNLLDPNIMEYELNYMQNYFTLGITIDGKYLYNSDESVVKMDILCSNTKMHKRYGYIVILKISFGNNTVKASIENDVNSGVNLELVRCNLEPRVVKNTREKIRISVDFKSDFLDLTRKKICYNLQFIVQNENDIEGFRITELFPLKNTLMMLNTDHIEH